MTTAGLSPPTLAPALARRLEKLAPDQRAAATTPPGPVLCVAPAGSGKTTTVVARLVWRVAGGVAPSSICALTFNRRAADELQARADQALGEIGYEPGSVRVRTFHALGREILADGGLDVSRIATREEVLRKISGGALSAAGLRWLDDAFTRFKLDPERGPPPQDEQTHRAFAAYQNWLDQRSMLDLDDLVAKATPVLQADATLLTRWRRRCEVLFVDEAQDLDRAQLDLAVLLSGDRRDIYLVGDDDQTIYAWRLADVRRVLGLASTLPGLKRVDLETNHRCAPEIVRRAARLVAHNEERFQKHIRPSTRTAGSLSLAPDPGDAVARARTLLTTWATAHPGESHAVLSRTNRELAPFAAVALELALPYRIEDDGLLLDEAAVEATVERARHAAAAGMPVLLALRDAGITTGLAANVLAALLAWAAPYADLGQLQDALRDRSTARLRLHRSDALLTLATMHGTKGLEWDHVACVGHDDGSFPSARSLAESTDPHRTLEEERRLAYVAWTRARRTLTLVFDPEAPSRFIVEAFDAHELD